MSIAQDFNVACWVYGFSPVDVLKVFIDHTSIYMSLSGSYLPGYREVANILSEHGLTQVVKGAPAFLKNKDTILRCLKKIISLIGREGISETEKMQKSTPIVDEIYDALEKSSSFDKVYIDENNILSIKKDFCFKCELHCLSPISFLNHFMSQISLPDTDARIALRMMTENPSMDFFELVTQGLGNLTMSRHLTIVEQEFLDEQPIKRYELFIVRDLTKRRRLLEAFYLKYYNKKREYGL